MTLSRACRRAAALVAVGSGLSVAPAPAVTLDWLPVGDPGNAPDAAANCTAPDCGSVPYAYSISRTELTNAHYAEFLNAKAAADTLALYSPSMGSSPAGGITRSGSPGSYTYAVKPGYEDLPVNFVGFYDALRFANWLHNGQGGGDTESGAYTLLGGTPTPSNGLAVARNPGAVVALPSENEWYKAAYYDGAAGTWLAQPAGSDVPPTCAAPTALANHANCASAVAAPTEVAAYPGSPSAGGSFDQGGNVWEWNEQTVPEEFRSVRGGGWNSPAASLAASAPSYAAPSTEDATVGFRLALVPAPSGAGRFAAAALAVLAARRSRRARDVRAAP